jgi:hypothetical protein
MKSVPKSDYNDMVALAELRGVQVEEYAAEVEELKQWMSKDRELIAHLHRIEAAAKADAKSRCSRMIDNEKVRWKWCKYRESCPHGLAVICDALEGGQG